MVNTIHCIQILIFSLMEVRETITISPNSDSNSNEQTKALKELMLSSDNLRPETLTPEPDSISFFRKSLGVLMPLPVYINDEMLRTMDSQKTYRCSLLQCTLEETVSPVCACNYNTGNVVTFKNKCDIKKHNCRYDTAFHVIFNEICPWEFDSRRNNDLIVNYDAPKYYN